MASGQFHHKVSVSYRFMVPKGLFCLLLGPVFSGWLVGRLVILPKNMGTHYIQSLLEDNAIFTVEVTGENNSLNKHSLYCKL